jgi:hypothetical protein
MIAERRTAAAIATAAALAGCGSTAFSTNSVSPAIPHALLAESRPIGRGARFHPAATGPVIGACNRRLGERFAVHIEVFAANEVVLLPAGIGTRPPLRYNEGRIAAAGCYGSIVTLEPTGLVLIRRGAALTTGDLFRTWGQPLSSSRLASFSAHTGVVAFVNGRRWLGRPGAIPLARHAEVVLEVGPHVPPHRFYTFPFGD